MKRGNDTYERQLLGNIAVEAGDATHVKEDEAHAGGTPAGSRTDEVGRRLGSKDADAGLRLELRRHETAGSTQGRGTDNGAEHVERVSGGGLDDAVFGRRPTISRTGSAGPTGKEERRAWGGMTLAQRLPPIIN